MDIEVTRRGYKSLEYPLRWQGIPPFAILAGENGSGKSQLLFALSETLLDRHKGREEIASDPPRIKIDNFTCQPTEVFYSTDLSKRITTRSVGIHTLNEFFRTHTDKSRKADIHSSELLRAINQIVPAALDSQEKINYLLSLKDYSLLYASPELLSSSVANHFLQYRYDCVNLQLEGCSDCEIISQMGTPPWAELNEFFGLLGLPYSVNDPTNLRIQQEFQIRLFDSRINRFLLLDDLSSGESTLVRLIMLMYASGRNQRRPRIFLLDEPDSHLHASLIDVFVKAVQEILVKRFECRVIMVSHRVETLSFAPSDSIFTMRRNEPRISIAKGGDHVVAMLSRNLLHVATKSIIVWVEDKSDEEFFNKCVSIAEKAKLWEVDFVPQFLTPTLGNSTSKGGRTVVRTWVQRLRETGLTNVFGLIDRDTSNEASEYVRVLGRYSVENYFCDPIFVFVCLMEKGSDFSDEVKFTTAIHPAAKLEDIPIEDVRKGIIWIAAKVEEHIEAGHCKLQAGNSAVPLQCGQCVDVPQWALDYRGHNLADLIYRIWKIRREDLKQAFVRHPAFWPKEFMDTLSRFVHVA